MASNYQVVANGADITSMIEIDSYTTALLPVYGSSVTTMDGVEHVSIVRYKGKLSFAANPQTDTQTERLSAALSSGIIETQYHCLQRNSVVIAKMRLDEISARHLGRVRFGGKKWNEVSAITLTEL